MRSPHVVIVGAGASGLSAASRLLSLQPDLSLTILEAQSRVGGRVNSVDVGGLSLERGAQWIHGQTNNVVFDMAMEHGLCDDPCFVGINGLRPFITDETGKIMAASETREFMKVYFASEVAMDNLECFETEDSLAEHLVPFLMREFEGDHLRRRIAVDCIHRLQCAYDACDTWHEVSFEGSVHDFEVHPDDNFNITFKADHKYDDIIHLLLQPVEQHVRLNAVVETVRLLNNEKEINDDNYALEVVLSNGEHLKADVVLMTVSLGVLKARARSMFEPSLSSSKLTAIDKFGFGLANKIFMVFESSFWPSDKGFCFFFHTEKPIEIEDIDEDDEELDWTRGVVGVGPVQHRPNALLMFVTGFFARRMEKLTDQRIVSDALQLLTQRLSNIVADVPEPVDFLISRWQSNPYVCGSWSFSSVAAKAAGVGVEDISRPEFGGCLRFAGEASIEKKYSTVHGAVDSGRREAEAIIRDFRLKAQQQ